MSSDAERKKVWLSSVPLPRETGAYRAMKELLDHGYNPVPLNPAFNEALGERCFKRISDVPQQIDTVTMYVGAARSDPLIARDRDGSYSTPEPKMKTWRTRRRNKE